MRKPDQDLSIQEAALKTAGCQVIRVQKATEQPIDTGTAAAKCFLDMLGVSQSSRSTYAVSGSWKASLSQRRRRLQGPATFDRSLTDARAEGQGTRDRPGLRLPGAGAMCRQGGRAVDGVAKETRPFFRASTCGARGLAAEHAHGGGGHAVCERH
jgi:hypothetical protein